MSNAIQAKARRERWLADGTCTRCGRSKSREGLRTCVGCAVGMANRDRSADQSGYARGCGRRPDKPGECIRCTAPAMPGKDVCASHHATLMELKREARG